MSLDDLVEGVQRATESFRARIAACETEEAVRQAQAEALGKKGRLSEVMKALGRLSPEERPRLGEAVNRAKREIEETVAARLKGLADTALAADLERSVDVTLPGRGQALGTLHPLTLVRQEIEEIFLGLGFEVRTGPWLETEWHNFDALNTPADHPARDMQDTFFVDAPAGYTILRSHTSPVQIRTMLERGGPPVKMIAPGNVFRRDDDATHTPMFPQVEGLCVDEGISFADLKGTLLFFVHRFFGADLDVRLRPSFFPFTEPSAEVDAMCFLCRGTGGVDDRGCRLCKGSGWIEIGGSGLVHPNVFRAVNERLGRTAYDPARVSGFAFGMGLSRMAMLKYGVDDLRSFYENDLRFLRQFR